MSALFALITPSAFYPIVFFMAAFLAFNPKFISLCLEVKTAAFLICKVCREGK
jgi:hypothetical protein